MSGFVNPFAQVGDYRNIRASSSDELVTTAYLTGLPDPRKIADEQAGIVFKQMLKRDSRTKQRALKEFELWLDGKNSADQVEDEVHLAYIQMYSKLSIDISAQIRSSSHVVLKKLYSLLAKNASKYLRYSVGPWVTALHDPDQRAEHAAREALDTVFPGSKSRVLVEKFKDAIRAFIYDACVNSTAQTLSDERYVTKEEASQKYTRLVKSSLDALASDPVLFDTESWEVSQLLENGVIWKFFSSSDALLARSALRLAHANLDKFPESVPAIWNELLRAGRKNAGGPGVAVEIIQLMNVCTKKYPEKCWPADESKRKDALASLGQFVATGSPHAKSFWPLLYNLVLMIPGPPQTDLTPLYKPLEKVVLKLRYNFELEESAWGCFVSLAAKMGPKFVHKAFRAAEARCQSPNVPINSIAKFLARFANTDGVGAVVEAQLQGQVPFEYGLILASTHAFAPLLENLFLPSLSPKEISLLLNVDSDLQLPTQLDVTADPEWLDVAVASRSVNSQSIVDRLAALGLAAGILKKSHVLYSQGVRISLDSFVKEHSTNSETLVDAVCAAGEFVSEEVAQKSLGQLIQSALDDEKHMNDLLRAVRNNSGFVNRIATSDDAVRHGLEALAAEDSHGILKKLSSLTVFSETAPSAYIQENESDLSQLDVLSLDLSVPEENVNNILRAPVPQTAKNLVEGLAGANELAASCLNTLRHPSVAVDEQLSVSLAILHEYFTSWAIVSPCNKSSVIDRVLNELRDLKTSASMPALWELTGSSNYSVAYHASMAIARHREARDSLQEFLIFRREYFVPPSLRGALVAYFSPAERSIQYDNLQRSLVREAVSGNLAINEYMLIDQTVIPEGTTIEVDASADGEDALKVALQITTFAFRVSDLAEAAFGSTSHLVETAALLTMTSTTNLVELLDFVSNVPQETQLDAKVSGRCLELVNTYLQAHPEFELETPDIVKTLVDRPDSLTINWIGLQLVRYLKPFTISSPPSEVTTQLTSSKVVSWLITLNFYPEQELLDNSTREILDWITTNLKKVRPSSLPSDIIELPNTPPDTLESVDLALNALYNLCISRPNAIREWYRDLRDRTLVKNVDRLLSTLVIPRILRSVRAEVSEEKFGAETNVSVNERQREVRASREVEDEFTVDIVISLPEQYPAKPAVVTVRNLAGVSEGKKRGWLLEARQNIQNKGLLEALSGLLSRLGNYLDGIEPCAICYMTVNDLNKLPNKSCSQCHNIYHSDCLYKWFSTNGNKLCPMCRSPM